MDDRRRLPLRNAVPVDHESLLSRAFPDGRGTSGCSASARMIHRLDRTRRIRICPVQSPLGRAIFRHYGMSADDPESWLLLHDGTPYRDAEGILCLAGLIGGWARVALLMRMLPRGLRAWLYRRVARNRYALLGRSDLCALPDPAFQARLLRS